MSQTQAKYTTLWRHIMDNNQQTPTETTASAPVKFCKHCGKQIAAEAIICPLCGCQVETMKAAESTPNIVINNSNMNTNTNMNMNMNPAAFKKPKNKWVALLLCLFFGFLGAHKFYEGKIGMGILYLFTGGLFVIGMVLDLIALLFKPNPYFV